jgi:hypothetical protein
MREMVFKNITSANHSKRDLYLSKTIERDGIICKSEREHHYTIKKESKFQGLKDLRIINKNLHPREIYLIKSYNSKCGKEAFICNIKGNFYFINKGYLYSVLFEQSFKIDFINSKK